MAKESNMSKTVGRAGMLMMIAALIAFFLGVFSIGPRVLVFIAIALFVMSLAAYFIEEFGSGAKRA